MWMFGNYSAGSMWRFKRCTVLACQLKAVASWQGANLLQFRKMQNSEAGEQDSTPFRCDNDSVIFDKYFAHGYDIKQALSEAIHRQKCPKSGSFQELYCFQDSLALETWVDPKLSLPHIESIIIVSAPFKLGAKEPRTGANHPFWCSQCSHHFVFGCKKQLWNHPRKDLWFKEARQKHSRGPQRSTLWSVGTFTDDVLKR